MTNVDYKIDTGREISLSNGAYTTIFSTTINEYNLISELMITVNNNDSDIKIIADGNNVISDFNLKNHASWSGNNKIYSTNFKLSNKAKVFNLIFPTLFTVREQFIIQVKANKNNKKASYFVLRAT